MVCIKTNENKATRFGPNRTSSGLIWRNLRIVT